jgi:hypothetical protein
MARGIIVVLLAAGNTSSVPNACLYCASRGSYAVIRASASESALARISSSSCCSSATMKRIADRCDHFHQHFFCDADTFVPSTVG